MNLLSRDEELSKIFRYNVEIHKPMFYRPNLLIHTKRVKRIALELANYLLKNSWKKIDIDLVWELAKFHDDTEIITWDYVSMTKISFSDEEQKKYENDCVNAIDILYGKYKNLSEKYDYKELLLTIKNKNWIEFLIVDLADKLDNHFEVTHELFAWNIIFSVILYDWGLNVSNFDYTKNRLYERVEHLLEYFWKKLDLTNTFLDLSSTFTEKDCLNNSSKHNLSTIWKNSGYDLYDKWLNLHFKYWSEDDINYLVNQLEF